MQVDTVCRLCSSCCPITAHVEQGRIVAAKRKTSLPPDKAWLCPKLEASADIVYSPARLRHPLIRQADNSYLEASWDEALDLVASRLLQCRQQHGAETVAWLRGMAADWGAPWDYVNRLMNAFGSPNSIGNGSVCHVAREMAHNYTYGAMTIPQIQKSDCIVIWGKNDQHTNPPAYDAIMQARERGARLIVVDPVRTGLAAMADIWLQIKPAHDGPLAMAMIDQIIRCGWYDTEFVAQWTTGFEDLRQAAAFYRAEDIAEQLSLHPADIQAASQLYAQSETACIIDGNGLDMQFEVFDATRAVAMLRALSGNLDRAGGDLIPQPVKARNIQLKECLPKDRCPVTSDYPLFSTFHHNWGLHAQSCVVDAILEGKPYPINSLVVQSGNPAVTMTDSTRVNQALSQLDFLVVIDLFMTRTALHADVILPACSCFEKTQLNRAYLRHSLVVLQNQVVEPLHNSWPDWKIIFELGRRLGLKDEFPWKCVEEAIDYQLEPSGVTVAALREEPEGIRTAPLEHQKYREKGFATPSGKVEFASERLQKAGFSAVPFADGRFDNPISFAGQADDYPLIGISGARSSCFTHSQFHHVPMLRQQESCPTVDIHPNDAKNLDISNGDQVELTSPRGRITLTGRIDRDMKPGTVRIAWGWGENEPSANLNNLTDDYRRNPITGTPSNRSFMCRLRKLQRHP
ncbi:formate dehydrogenase [Syntrophotalea acetylenivorans]|uniref:Formate dehydrogenase n=1 Tax=Syntrophotalea acetylenivorans TaxID=1842532 RepID=A0A1L3GM54_9BACT|nr:molybdopterin-dependent oxidoreductase [Syntrophotalea acetylenivorans]APG27014.1 formate dehydrogenase [Syntrophotalea acetylenivorans]